MEPQNKKMRTMLRKFQGCQKCLSTGLVYSKRNPGRRSVPCPACDAFGIIPFTDKKAFHPVCEQTLQRPIVIVGAGIGGVALALALQQRGLSCKVFERDGSFDERAQGYGLTMQQAATTLRRLGFENVKDLGALSEYHASYLPSGDLVSCYGRTIHSTTRKTGGNGKGYNQRFNIHIPRQRLRQLMLDELEPNTVQWGRAFDKFDVSEDGKLITTSFLNRESGVQETYESEYLVGADGIWSQVRTQKLGQEPPRFLGLIVILGRAPCDHPLAVDKVFQTLGGETRIYTMPFEEGVTMWQLSFRMPYEDAKALSAAGPEALLEESKKRCGTWHEPLPQILNNTNPKDVTGYPVYDRPPPTYSSETDPQPNVVLIGDAIHPMSPFKGQGANQAVIDGLTLARILCSVPDQPIQEFMHEMTERVRPKIEKSALAAKVLHTEKGVDVRAGKLVT